MLYRLARPAIFQLDPEKAHDSTIKTLSRYHHTPLRFLYSQHLPPRPVTVMGLHFTNPVGLAAGLDKNGECIEAFGAMGFGFVEVGTVTPRAQSGNDKPRLFRLKAAEGIINRMGFNNHGVEALVENVKRAKKFRGRTRYQYRKKTKTHPLSRALMTTSPVCKKCIRMPIILR